ncbi:hypothetical protein EUGRSUZ_J01446 [Eucalyptus grandis]|uniref:Uncharacterized protein n=2 Tax=Eucalyptus grandis TaxID=71139 RepID=A0A059AEE9_EUCGR|nr:hypothetical protein EUGRSUZ_J01446 [Eucalyptus grandis]
MDNSKMGFNAGQAKGQTQEKSNQMMDKASNTAQSARDSMQEVTACCSFFVFFFFLSLLWLIGLHSTIRRSTIQEIECRVILVISGVLIFCCVSMQTGQQMKAKAQGAADAVKNATGMNK